MEDQTATKACLEVLPRSISDAHRRLRHVIDRLCVLEDFLVGSQVRDVGPETDKEPPGGVIDKCFCNLAEIGKSIGECDGQLGHIIDKLGIPVSSEPTDERKL